MYKTMNTNYLENFGYRELDIASKLLGKVAEHGYPKEFSDQGVSLQMNVNSGYVFLTNDQYQVLLLENNKLTIIEDEVNDNE